MTNDAILTLFNPLAFAIQEWKNEIINLSLKRKDLDIKEYIFHIFDKGNFIVAPLIFAITSKNIKADIMLKVKFIIKIRINCRYRWHRYLKQYLKIDLK